MAVLVTGGAGYIGSHTCVELLESGEEIIIVDNFVNSKHEALDRIRNVGRDVVEESSFEMDSLRDRKVIPDSGQSPAIEDANVGLARIRDAVVDLDPSGTPSTLRGRLSRAVSKLPGGAGLRADRKSVV